MHLYQAVIVGINPNKRRLLQALCNKHGVVPEWFKNDECERTWCATLVHGHNTITGKGSTALSMLAVLQAALA